VDETRLYYYGVLVIRELSLINLYALVGQGILYALAGAGRESNPFYRVIKIIASPAMWLARRVTPKFVVDRHVGWVALLLLVVIVVVSTVLQQVLAGQLMEQAS
jgi:hypothetical protein